MNFGAGLISSLTCSVSVCAHSFVYKLPWHHLQCKTDIATLNPTVDTELAGTPGMAALHPTVGSSPPHQEALHSMTISNEAPEIAYSDDIKLDAACIVCTSLLETLDRYDVNLNLKVKFRLELLPKFNDLWAVRLKLDGVAWFDYLEKLMKDKEALAKIVRAYYDTCQRLGSPEVAQCFDERVAPKTYCINPYCIYKHNTGQRKPTSCRTICKGANLPTIMEPCSTVLARLDGSSPICYFFLFDEFVIREEGKALLFLYCVLLSFYFSIGKCCC